MTAFTDTFNEHHKPLALHHKEQMTKYYRLFMYHLDKGDLKKSEVYFNHFIALKGEIDRLQREKQTVDQGQAELNDGEIQKRKDWF